MKILIDRSFVKDFNKIKDKNLLININGVISALEHAESLDEIPNIKKIKGYKTYFRLRIGDYRIGIERISKEKICLIRFLHRKDVYKYFPMK